MSLTSGWFRNWPASEVAIVAAASSVLRSIAPRPPELAPGHGAHDQERLGSACNGLGEWGLRRVVGQVLLAREEAHERPALVGELVTDGTAEHGIPLLERVENRAKRRLTIDGHRHLVA